MRGEAKAKKAPEVSKMSEDFLVDFSIGVGLIKLTGHGNYQHLCKRRGLQ